ncbi:MAG: TIGR03086 family protein [Actinobacteria bacterium]|nr:TIGR03086 family protein [Actinomycetota bacterium]
MTTRLRSAEVTLPSDLEVLITRRFEAPMALVWRAITEPALLLRWWGPDWCPMTGCEVDLRVGGTWRYLCENAEGMEFGWHGEYREIETGRRIVTTEVFEGFPDAASLNTMTLEEDGGVTTLRTLVLHQSKANRDGHLQSGMETGMQITFDRLDHLLDQFHTPAGRFARIAGRFGEVVDGVRVDQWNLPAPCDGWVARDIVRHLVEWVPGFLSRAELPLAPGPSVDDDPAGAWHHLAVALQACLDDPVVATREFDAGPLGRMTVERALDMAVLGDVFVHTWDLARATGQDERLDPDMVHAMFEGMQPMDEMLRSSGHFGPKVAVAADADEQTKLIAFTGRTP